MTYFRLDRASLEELVRIGQAHPSLRRVEPALRKYPSYYGQPSDDDLRAESRVYDILEAINADFVSYERTGEQNDLYCVDVPFYRWGLSLGGVSQSLIYFPRKNPPPSDKKFKCTQIDDSAWYVVDSDTR